MTAPAFDPTQPVVPEDAVSTEHRSALSGGALLATREREVRLRLTGAGRVACLQGLLTCDIVRHGDGSRVFGALLTGKGMVVSPLWVSRLSDSILIELPEAGADAVREVFARSLPPRLCRSEDVTGTTIALALCGPRAPEVLARVAGPLPSAGAAALAYASSTATIAPAVARGTPGYDLVLPAALARAFADDLLSNGACAGPVAALELCRILGGIPRLGAEIDERTLPQEVRFEELGAISYTKGCYVGQETVARLHFRGHANRRIAALALDAAPARLPQGLTLGDRAAGRLTSAAWHHDLGRWFALGVVRREVEPGAVLHVDAGGPATVLPDPWAGA